MRRAADAVVRLISDQYEEATRVVIYTGAGNNAGDGYLVAVGLLATARTVRVVQLVPGDRLQGDASSAWQQALDANIEMEMFDVTRAIDEELVVDALLGTGITREPEGSWAAAIDQINASDAVVLAVDVPSGLFVDSGKMSAHTVQATDTATFISCKQGLCTGDGPDCTGQVWYDALGVDTESLDSQVRLISYSDYPPKLRRHNTHKRSYGHVLVVGGQAGYQGAAQLCGMSVLRAGGGMVSLAQPRGAARGGTWPELMCHEVEDRVSLRRLAASADVVAIGPGLGEGQWAHDMLSAVLELQQPRVVDAQALRLLAAEPRRHKDWVLTPHPGEAGDLLGVTSAEVQQDRFKAVSNLARQYGGVAVLKGCGTLISQGERLAVCADGNPGLATAGTGDVLTGVIASLISQGDSLFQAACRGVCLHAAAGDKAGGEGGVGLVASDLLVWLRQLSDPQ